MHKLIVIAFLTIFMTACASNSMQDLSKMSPSELHNMGLDYASGQSGAPNFSKAVALFEASAKKKHPPAQFDYAMVLYGMAPPEYKNPVEAFAWFTVVTTNYPAMFPSAETFREELQKQLSKQELEKAENLGEQYVQQYSP